MTRPFAHALAEVASVAASQDGLVTARQLAEIGVDRDSAGRRVQTGGPWALVLPGIYAVNGHRLDGSQRLTAALLYTRAPVALTGVDALRVARVRAVERLGLDPVHVLIPHSRRRSSRGFVVVERTQNWPTVAMEAGRPVVPLARAAVDACRRLGRRADVDAILSELVQTERCTQAQLVAELAAAQRRGTALARQALEGLAAGAASAPELELRSRWLTEELPAALWNPDLVTTAGEFIARPDAYLPEHGVVVEVNSVAFHFGPRAWDRDMRRQARINAHGIIVLAVTPRRIRDDWGGIVREIRTAVRAQRGRDWTHVLVRPATAA